MGEHTELRRNITNDNKIMLNLLGKIQIKTKAKPLGFIENNCKLNSVNKP